jgi:hypothetical protein
VDRRGIPGLVGAIGAALALAGCGSSSPPADFQVDGVGVRIQTDAAFAHQGDFPKRVESTVGAALRYWGGSWETLRGATITFEGAAHVACPGSQAAVGCFDGDIRVSTLDAGTSVRCVEQTVLVHEVGHAVLGDQGHLDPRWMDFAALERELAGRPGYTAAGAADCAIFPSVWRHPPRR